MDGTQRPEGPLHETSSRGCSRNLVARVLSVLLSGSFLASPLQAQKRVDVTRDLWISSYETEQEGNNGGSPKLKLKGVQEFFLVDFAGDDLRGKRVTRAQLHLHLEGAETLGRITVSTVAEPWVEGRGTGYAKIPGASSFAWARTGELRWKDADVTGSILGCGGTIWGFGDASPPDAAGWQIIPVDPRVVQARIDDRSHGFCVMDDVGSEYERAGNSFKYRSFPNRYVASREGKRGTAPFFTVWLEDGGDKPPVAVREPGQLSPAEPARLPLASWPAVVSEKLPVDCWDEWGGPLSALEFCAARGECIGFSVAADAKDVALELPAAQIRLYAMPKVGEWVDPLVPVGFSGAPDGESGGTFVDVRVEKGVAPGRYEGFLRVRDVKIPCAVVVWDFALPDRLSFLPQMNCYGLPPGQERAYYRLAQEHRTVLNCLPYGWTGKVKAAPRVAADGGWDWRAWDAEFGPLLDGSAFADLPRGPIPVEAFYLPLNENWPMDHEKHFRGGYWIESAYDDEYWAEFRAAAGRFAEHLAAKNWTEPMFEFYLNNKVYFKKERGNRWDGSSAAWIFDEPMNTQDFWALRRFGLEFWSGVAAYPGARFVFRADISRPQWQRDLLDGVTSAEVVSGVLRAYQDRVMNRSKRFENTVYVYGSSNRIGTSNAMPAAWCVEAWAMGADGVVPWQTVGKEASWRQPDELSLFYPTPHGPLPSLRLKAFRAGQQLAEYLTLYAEIAGEGREPVGAAVLAKPGLRATLKKRSDADAGSSLFGPEAHASLVDLRMALGQWLHARHPAPRDRWYDPRPPVRRDLDGIQSPVPLRVEPAMD